MFFIVKLIHHQCGQTKIELILYSKGICWPLDSTLVCTALTPVDKPILESLSYITKTFLWQNRHVWGTSIWMVLYQAFIMNFRLQVLLKKFHHSVSQWQMILELWSGTLWALRDTISRKELVNRNRSLGPKQSTFPASLLNTYTLKYMKTYILYLCHLFTFITPFYFYNFLIEMAFDCFKNKGEKL